MAANGRAAFFHLGGSGGDLIQRKFNSDLLNGVQPDETAFPCLRLARDAAAEGGTAPCVMNAANEVAVQAFLDGHLPFTGIPEMIERALETVERQPLTSFDDLYLADAQARRVVEGAVA